MKYIVENKFIPIKYVFTEIKRGTRSTNESSLYERNRPMMQIEAETFADMVARGKDRTMTVEKIYRIEKE